MEPDSEKPLRLFVNPFTIWTQLAFKTAEAMWATAHAAALRANAPRVAVIPTADAPAANEDAPREAPVRKTSKAARFKANRAMLRRKVNGKRRRAR